MVLSAPLAGCEAGAHSLADPPVVPTTSETPTRHTPSPATPTEATTPSKGEKQLEYEAEIASWPERLPAGYMWPAWEDLPHTEPYGVGYFAQADNAQGVYRCILIDAAWHAYFETNDAVASKDFATRADAYAIPENPSITTVTADGVILDEELARANGICLGVVGDLHR